ncbi:hypothetical protein MPDQ_003734 [Monascus purpureus]|uniref:Uncharacterized protein n=1 Tax=Monascus purpureus TaxID=5098 RepID=A0A507QIF5_MONPU|nr:hypothetical protein MPDQ_003734 [Monascus purpureus]
MMEIMLRHDRKTNLAEYVKSLGSNKVCDYNSPTVTDDVAVELDKGPCVGIYLATGKVAAACQVSAKSMQKLFVSSSNPVMPGDAPEGVEAKMAYDTSGTDGLKAALPATFGGYLLEALAKDMYKVAPPPEMVNKKGVDGIQEALDRLRNGISAKKIAVEAPWTPLL